jgi:streptogramin lyase
MPAETRATAVIDLREECTMNLRRLLVLSLALSAALALAGRARAGLWVRETPLSPDGTAYDLNLDSQGTLWISDWGAGEIRSFDPSTGAYTSYLVGGSPSDARSDGAGTVWWADYFNNQLARLATSTGQTTAWKIPNSTTLYSTALDPSDVVWVSDRWASSLYRLDPGTNQLCTYALPDMGVIDHLYADGNQLWFGDTHNARIVRLQGDTFDWWNLPAGSQPRGMEMAGNGQLWWTDPGLSDVGLLDTGQAKVTTFTPPVSGQPQMLAEFGGKLWYSQQDPGQVVVLDPAVAVSQTITATTGTLAVTPSCGELLPLDPVSVATTSGVASWTEESYPTTLDEGGWTVYEMPLDSAPWGIAATDRVWVVDQYYQLLVTFTPTTEVYLPLLQR